MSAQPRARENFLYWYRDDGERILPLAPFWTAHEKKPATDTKAAYNCLHPAQGHLLPCCSFRHGYPAELQRSVVDLWEALGFQQPE